MGTDHRTKCAFNWNPSCWTNGFYWVIYLYKYRTGVGYKSKVYSKIVAITKLQGSMKYSFWKLDTHSILHTYRHIYMLKGTISYWLNSSNPLRSSNTDTSFFNGIKHSEPYQFHKLLETIMNGLFPLDGMLQSPDTTAHSTDFPILSSVWSICGWKSKMFFFKKSFL